MAREKTLEDLEAEGPALKLTGSDGNAYSVLAACKRKARKFGCTNEALDELQEEMLSGDYNHVLQTAMKYFEVD